MDDARRRLPARWLAMAATVGLVVRLAFGFLYWTGQPLTRDEQEYLSLARSLAHGNGFVYDAALTATTTETFGRAPAYPLFVAIVGGGATVTTEVPAALKLAQSVAGAAGVVLVGLIAYRLAGTRASVAAAFMAAVYPPLVWIAAYALSEALFWPLGLAAAWTFDRVGLAARAWVASAACGVLTGIGVLVRPAMLLFVPMAALVLIRRQQWLPLLALLLGVMMVLGPWAARNYVTHDRVIVASSTGGVNFWVGNHPLAVGDGDMAANPAIKIDNARLRAQHPGLTEEMMEPIYYREALNWIRTNPVDWIVLEARKLVYLIVPIGPSYTLHSTRYQVASIFSYAAVLVLALLSLRVVRPNLHAVTGLWLLVGSAVLAAFIFFPQERFRIPILDPALIVLAGVWVGARRATRPEDVAVPRSVEE